MDDPSTVARMNQVQLLLPVVILLLGVARSTVEVADETTRWNPEERGDGDDSH